MLDRASIRLQNRTTKKIASLPHPFMKWAGGKRQLLAQIDPHLPKEYGTYIEPFTGGGALFFYLLPERAVLIDVNELLIKAYQVIQSQVDPLIQSLKTHKNEKEYYYLVRAMDRAEDYVQLSDIEKVSRILYMNKCCFNGLYRVNSKGYFNVPFGKYKNPKFCDPPNLHAVSEVLNNVTLLSGSFDQCLTFAKKEDFIYFDPPYHPLSSTANFASYAKDSFSEDDQRHLKDVVDKLHKRGCKILQSNSYSDFILDLYQDYEIIEVKATRMINRDANKRGKIKEVLIKTYSD